MKFRDGYMVKSGQPTRDYIDAATTNALLRQGIVGIKVKIMLPHDWSGKLGPKTPQPDVIKVYEPKEDDAMTPSTAPAIPQSAPASAAAAPQQPQA